MTNISDRRFPPPTTDLVEALTFGWNQHLEELAHLRDSWRHWSNHLANEGKIEQADAVAGCANEIDGLIGRFKAQQVTR